MVTTFLKNTLLLLFLLLFICCKHRGNLPLFPIKVNDRIGYIDSSGNIVIEPIFRRAGKFCARLAVARKDGQYGYIDKTGEFVIQPQFDLAEDFHEGIAAVYINHKLFYIDTLGSKLFGFSAINVSGFINGRAIIKTFHNTLGLINRQGKLIVDTVFESIGEFENGVAIVNTPFSDSIRYGKYGVIDTNGRFLVPLGKYYLIRDYKNGYAYVQISHNYGLDEEKSSVGGFIDKTGKLVFTVKMKKDEYMSEVLSEGLAAIAFSKEILTESNNIAGWKTYYGYIDLNGKLVISDTAFHDAYEFHNGRAFVKDANDHYRIIDKRGKYATNTSYKDVYNNTFDKSVAFVQDSTSWWRCIDTTGKPFINAKFGTVEYFDTSTDLIYYSYHRHFGISTLKGDTVIAPLDGRFADGFINGLLQVNINNIGISYISTRGNIVWRQAPSERKLENMNIDFTRSARYVVHGDIDHSNTIGITSGLPKNVIKDSNFQIGTISIISRPSIKDTFKQETDKCIGFRFYLINNTDTTVQFESTCHGICIVIQALSTNNQWKDIEYSDGSWCCTGSDPIKLQPHKYWVLNAPNYEGSFKTKLRIKATYIKKERFSKDYEGFIYSNEFEGYLNPAQFYSERKSLIISSSSTF